MQTDQKKADPSYLYVLIAVIFLLTAWGATFSRTCQSDGCMGVIFPLGGALIALAVQLFVVVPFHRMRARSKGEVSAGVVTWVVVSIAAFVLPLLFAKF
ncbi:hypothetical protein DT603_14290 [Pseudoxanthomonas gei]|uniref:Uncharacterized protein n=1 Tax=Pseudoxanthomonas gei TaxID=1383030 RepID=A0ABX0AEH8_9GAMM|nr:hypothetical protein [Pseudoxanthomonas gei]NDK40009.1 hypothetical protein [Pseudoxanthomonas gei]